MKDITNNPAAFQIMFRDEPCHCNCGKEWIMPDDMFYCSKKCYKDNSIWELYNRDTEMSVEDECNGCGQPMFFDVGVRLRPLVEKKR